MRAAGDAASDNSVYSNVNLPVNSCRRRKRLPKGATCYAIRRSSQGNRREKLRLALSAYHPSGEHWQPSLPVVAWLLRPEIGEGEGRR
jgi:hypothetical protein